MAPAAASTVSGGEMTASVAVSVGLEGESLRRSLGRLWRRNDGFGRCVGRLEGESLGRSLGGPAGEMTASVASSVAQGESSASLGRLWRRDDGFGRCVGRLEGESLGRSLGRLGGRSDGLSGSGGERLRSYRWSEILCFLISCLLRCNARNRSLQREYINSAGENEAANLMLKTSASRALASCKFKHI